MAAIAVAALVLGACGDDGDGGGDAAPASTTTTVTVPAPTDGEGFAAADLDNGLVLARGLPRAEDLPDGFEARAEARAFADSAEGRLQWCGEDLRAETGAVQGMEALLVDEDLQVSTVVDGLGAREATAYLERFQALADGCAAAWEQPRTGVGEGDSLTAEILGPVDLPELAPPASGAAYAVSLSSAAGESVAVVAVVAAPPLVSSVTVSGPASADLTFSGDVVAAAAERLVDLAARFG